MKSKLSIPQGSLLVSEPFLLDDQFKRSVVLMADKTEKGSFGFILNKPSDIKINDAIEDFPKFDAELYFGGPVEIDTLFYIHTLGESLEGSKLICKNIYWGGNYEDLKQMILLKKVTTSEIIFFAGYAGWNHRQLTRVIKRKIFIPTSNNFDLPFFKKTTNLWRTVLRSMGGPYALMANYPEDPSLN